MSKSKSWNKKVDNRKQAILQQIKAYDRKIVQATTEEERLKLRIQRDRAIGAAGAMRPRFGFLTNVWIDESTPW